MALNVYLRTNTGLEYEVAQSIPVTVAGTVAAGAAISGEAPTGVAGSDGTNKQWIKVDGSTGRLVIVGAAASGAAVTGNPVLVAGSDGTNAVSLKVASTGALVLRGEVAAGSAASGTNPISICGTDGTNLRAYEANLPADAFTNSVRCMGVQSFPMGYIGGASPWDRLRTPKVFTPVALTAATAETTIWTPTSGKKFRLMGFILTPGAASTLTFKDNTSGTTIFVARGATDTPIVVNLGNGILSSAINQPLTVTRGTSATLDGCCWGTEE